RGRRQRRRAARGPWQDDRERGARAGFALDDDVAAHRAGELATDRQAKTGSLNRSRQTAVPLDEGLEDRIATLRWDAGTGVRDQDAKLVRTHLAVELDPAGRCELDRVRDQVEDELLELLRLGPRCDRRTPG